MTLGSHPSRVAAFFDLDGTLIPFPSLERRLVRALLYRHAIPVGNFALWLTEALRLASRGFAYMRQANKAYLRGVGVQTATGLARQLAAASRLSFFPQAFERLAWHAARGHRIALISGTPELLARCVARSLEAELGRRGTATTIFVRATRLQENCGQWTGRVAGEQMFGREKAAAVSVLASRLDLDLSACYAYGDSASDRYMLDCVGHPVAVNASKALQHIAGRRGWQTVQWRLPDSTSNFLACGSVPSVKKRAVTPE